VYEANTEDQEAALIFQGQKRSLHQSVLSRSCLIFPGYSTKCWSLAGHLQAGLTQKEPLIKEPVLHDQRVSSDYSNIFISSVSCRGEGGLEEFHLFLFTVV
jgi:hypothetical protein